MELTEEKGVHQFSLLEGLSQLEKFVGNTPLYPLNRVFQKPGVKIYAKLEWQQFGSSVKTRAAYNIVKDAIFTGKLDRAKTLWTLQVGIQVLPMHLFVGL